MHLPALSQDADGCVPFFWGADANGNLVLADEKEVVTKSYGTSYAPFLKHLEGCLGILECYINILTRGRKELRVGNPRMENVGFFFTTSGGLSNFEHPLNELKSIPRVDSSGQVCAATFKMDEAKKESTGMSRVGSAANWSNNI
ncbi:hypothetical protein S83_054056 [Arachis hypogaea]